jgi:hypothetical protein
MSAKNFFRRCGLRFLVMLERSGHRTTSPRVYCEKPVRTASVVAHAPWSQPSLRSRSGMEASQTWPLLSRPASAPLIPARPFGLGLRFDEALLVAPKSFAPEVSSQPAKQTARSTFSGITQSPGSKPLVETVEQGSMRSTRAGSASDNSTITAT